jgi:hypothetical protein
MCAASVGAREQDLESARGCINHLERIFRELADYRAFELLRTHAHRSDYLLLKQVSIVSGCLGLYNHMMIPRFLTPLV